jgi:hypothetical protein
LPLREARLHHQPLNTLLLLAAAVVEQLAAAVEQVVF